jgi:DNA-directed RNA polymerase beta subunit
MSTDNLGIINEINQTSKSIKNMAEILSSELNQPFTFVNSANRKMMFDAQFDQKISLMEPEIAMLSTGFDIMGGEYTSSFIKTPTSLRILHKIMKYDHVSASKYVDYVLVVYNEENKMYDIITRDSCQYNTETYGFLWNNDYLDSLKIGQTIPKETVIKKSTNYDNFNNRLDGTNLLVAFMSPLETSEDAILINQDIAETKLASPVFDMFDVTLNDNDIPLNLFGNDTEYKAFPNIGEEVEGIIMVTRRENKDEILYTHAYSRLSQMLPSDTTYYTKGIVIDVSIYCNNPTLLAENQYYSQLYQYYLDSMEYSRKVVGYLKPLIEDPHNDCSTDLKRFYKIHKDVMDGKEWLNNGKPFSNTVLKFTVIDKSILSVGDKLTNRFGGKGIVSEIYPKEKMPMYKGRPVDMVLDLGGVVGRKNPGQLFETELNNVSDIIIKDYKINGNIEETLKKIYIYMRYVDEDYAMFIKKKLYKSSNQIKKSFLDSLIDVGLYKVSNPTNIMTLDLFAALIRELGMSPRDLGDYLMVPIEGSDGKIRYVQSLRKFYPGYMYIYRLKQIAEHKFSSTTLSTTNIKGLPAAAKINKKGHKLPYASTPIQFGEMESAEYEHLGSVLTALNLMTYSTAPIARRACSALLNGDPYNISIDVPDDARSRVIEILNVFFKSMGLKLIFEKKLKRTLPCPIHRRSITRPNGYYGIGTPVYREFNFSPINRTPQNPIARHNNYEIRLVKDK